MPATEPASTMTATPACPPQLDEPDQCAPAYRCAPDRHQPPASHAGPADGTATDESGTTTGPLRMLWAELGLECQLQCLHCYAGAGPRLGFGTMTTEDWENAIRDAARLGTRHVTFIGGEPTLSPALPRLVRLAVGLHLSVEVYTNLVRITPALWELFTLPGVSLATSWYTSNRTQHRTITAGHDSWRQTRANIAASVRQSIPIRAGIVGGVVPGQQADDAERELRALGVSSISHDHVRQFGRGTIAAPSEACGGCGLGRAAVLSDGTVTPCPLTRWLAAGNVRDTGLEEALKAMPGVTTVIPRPDRACNPDCIPDSYCDPLCIPGACKPRT